MPELAFPEVDRPAVSVVMVAYNAAGWARRALAALLEHTEPCYELIVVDNASSDDTPELLANEVAGATVLRNDRNRGFGPANNQAASHAVGRHVLFLNNDLLVKPGWLGPLLRRVDWDGRVGAVGPRIVNLDGSLQIAGALTARSGSTLEYGYGDDPDAPQYTFARAVDYLSGACLLVRRSAFVEVGGFDGAYGHAYFEDADLCLSLAARGYRVVYEPRSTVAHVRGASPRGEALAALALRNRSRFAHRWDGVLASRPLSPLAGSPRRILAARDGPARERVLVIDTDGEPLVGAASTTRVTLVTRLADAEKARRLRDAGIEVIEVDDRCSWLGERRFHYDIVVAPDTDAELEAALARTQPQATRVRPDAELGDVLAAVRAAGGLV